jgi:hypothetical protein
LLAGAPVTRWSICPVVVTRHQVVRCPVRSLLVDHCLLRSLWVPTFQLTDVVPALVRSVIHTTLPTAQVNDPNSDTGMGRRAGVLVSPGIRDARVLDDPLDTIGLPY